MNMVTVSSPKLYILHFVCKRDGIKDRQTDRQTNGQTDKRTDGRSNY